MPASRIIALLAVVLSFPLAERLQAAEFSKPASKESAFSSPQKPKRRKPASTETVAQTSLSNQPKSSANLISFSTGITSATYQQTGLASVNALILTPKLDYRRQIGQSRWSFGINTFFSAMTLSSNLPADTSMRFLGVNWRIAYRLTEPKDAWNVEISGGTYYETMMVTNQAFGFQNLIGPQTVLRMARAVSPSRRDTSFIAAYAKYALMTEGFSLTNMSNRETAFGISWAGKLAGAPVSIMTDYATLDLSDDTDSVSLRSFSFGVGYRYSF